MNPFPFIGPAYRARSENYSAQRCVNLYLEAGKGKGPGLLIGTPGLSAPWVALGGSGGCRGFHSPNESTVIMVCGANVFAVTLAGVATVVGTVPDDGRPVSIAGNGIEVAIASAGQLYSVTTTSSVSTFIRNNVESVDFLDGRFVIVESNSGRFYVSGLYTSTIAALDFATAEGSPDNLIGLIASRRQLFLLGSKSLEQWYTAGGSFPLSRIDGAFFEVGCIAKASIAKLDTPFWLGGDDKGAGAVWTMNGGQPSRVSTPAIEYAINQWPDMTDAEAFTYSQEGHAFYVLSSVSGNETWAYDLATGEWHQRAYLSSAGDLHRIKPRCHVYFAGRHLVGDRDNGNVYEYSLDVFSDNGNPLPRVRACPTLQEGLENQPTVNIRLDMDSGVGLTTGQGENPQAMLRCSKDGGKRWGNALWRTFGRIGETARRVYWNRVGGGERVVFEVTITDPVKVCITGAYLE